MATKQITVSFRTTSENKDYFDQCFEGSGASSKGEFITMLLDRYNEQPERSEPVTVEVEKIVEIARKHEQNEIVLMLSPAQMFALRNTILSTVDFVKEQNLVIDKLSRGDRPFMYFGSLFEPEFQSLWIRNKLVTNQMSGEEKEAVLKFNMSAFLLNMFFTNLIEGRISETLVTVETLKAFIKKPVVTSKLVPVPGSNPKLIN